jgi:UDP-glucose 4-epimerase
LRRALVTGGAGFIGSHVAQRLLEAGHTVLVVDNLATGSEANLPSDVQFSKTDITDEDRLEVAVSSFRPDVILHQAAQTLVAASASDPAFDAEINVIGTLNVVKAAARAGCSKLVFASSGGTVYGNPEQQPVSEEAPLRPISAYGTSKVAGENYVRVLCDQMGMAHSILRYGNVFGPRDIPASKHVITAFLYALNSGEAPVIEWDGDQSKDYVYVGDVAEANLRVLDGGDGEAFNVGSGTSVSVNQIFELVCSVMDVQTTAVRRPKRTGDVREFTLDCSKARSLLGWEPRTPFQDALRITAQHYRNASQTSAAT